MKYGILTYSSYTPNIGDFYQTIGIKKAYEMMNIPKSEIVEIDRDYLADYNGEYVVLPITSFVDVLPNTSIFPLSEKIIPVFIGTHCIDDKHLDYMKKYRNFGPFGCRDMETVRRLRKIGLDAYLSGCLSLCADKREEKSTQTKVFLVDVKDEVKKYIPKNILENAVEVTHEFSRDKNNPNKEEREKFEKRTAEDTLNMYRDEAKLIITSRLHCALPCTAMGIPVIVCRDMREHRFEGVDKLLNYYTPDEYDKIDWNPTVPDIEELKVKLLDLTIHMIQEKYEKYHRLCDISSFYEDKPYNMYYSGIHSGYLTMDQKRNYFLNKTPERDLLSYIVGKDISSLNLIIYGAGDKGMWMYRRYRNLIRKFKSAIYVDKNRCGQELNGLKVENPSIIDTLERGTFIIIVAADKYYEGAGLAISNELINKYDFRDGKDFYMLDKLNASSQLYLDDISTVESWADGF